MIQVPAKISIYVMHQSVNFRKGIDGLAAVVRQVLRKDPMDGSLFVFRSKTGKAIRILCYDGGGFWLCTRRLSKGVYKFWPCGGPGNQITPYLARELQILLWGGNPSNCTFPSDWRKLT